MLQAQALLRMRESEPRQAGYHLRRGVDAASELTGAALGKHSRFQLQSQWVARFFGLLPPGSGRRRQMPKGRQIRTTCLSSDIFDFSSTKRTAKSLGLSISLPSSAWSGA